MSAAGNLQSAVAHLLVDDELRSRFATEPAALGRQFSLTEEQVRQLGSIAGGRLELASHLVRSKRLNFLGRGLPATVQALSLNGMHRLVHDFSRDTWPSVDENGAGRGVAEGRRFLAYLYRCGHELAIPAWLLDLAAFELAGVELLGSVEASESARRAQRCMSRTIDPRSDTVTTGSHVRVLSCQCDVIEVRNRVLRGEIDDFATGPVHFTIIKRPASRLARYRTGAAVAAMLRFCAQPQRIPEICTVLRNASIDQALGLVQRGIAEGALLVCSD